MKFFIFFACALLLCYSQEWGPYYVSIFSSDNVRVLGSLNAFAEDCSQQPVDNIQCKVQYRIPKKNFLFNQDNAAIGLGIVIHATEVLCEGDPEVRFSVGDVSSAGKTLDLLNTYQVVPLQKINCKRDLIVRAWAPTTYRRYGAIGSAVVIGDLAQVLRVKVFTEFFRTPFLIFFTALFLGVFTFNQILSRLMQVNGRPTALEAYSYAWVGFTFFASGMANSLIPVVSESFLMTRLANFFGIVALAGPGVVAIARSNRIPQPLTRICAILSRPYKDGRSLQLLHAFVGAFVLSPFFAKFFGPACLVISTSFLMFGILSRRSLLLFFGMAGVSDSLKMLMVPYLPTSYLFMVFSLFCIIDSFVARVRRSAGLVSLLKWNRDQIEGGQASKPVPDILRDFADQFGFGQISLIVTKPSGGCEIVVQSRSSGEWESSRFYKDRLPPMFAHVLTTREALWHIQEESLFAVNLRKGAHRKQNYDGEYFSIIPLLKDSIPVGAVAITNYPSNYVSDEFLRLKLTSVANLLFPYLASTVAHNTIAERHGWVDKCTKAAGAILALKGMDEESTDASSSLARITRIVAEHLNVAVFLARLDPTSRRLHLTSLDGYSREVSEMYKKAEFYAVAHNEQGPLALAVNRKKAVTVGDVNWLASVLHPMTLKIFDAAGTQSCAAVPIFYQDDQYMAQSEDIWGILWLESKEVGVFLPQIETGLYAITQAIEAVLSHRRILDAHNRTKQALAGFVPAKIFDKVVRGETAREEEVGYLLMADIRDSTRISRLVGAEKWGKFTKALTGPAEDIASKHGYTLQCVIWDALYFTRGETIPDGNRMDNLIDLAEELNGLIHFAAKACFGDATLDRKQARARFCFVYGDITRDIRSSLNDNWTIVGTAMAVISKLEQTCKGVSGWLFVGGSATQSKPSSRWSTLERQAPGTDESIFSYDSAITLRRPDVRILEEVVHAYEDEKRDAA